MWRAPLLAVLAVAASGIALGREPRWEPQLREMGYLFLHISNINVVNGLNLTREQAVKLQRLARQVERVSPRPPTLRDPLSPALAGVRRDWLELRALLLRDKPVPEELQARVNQSRATESAAIRKTIRPSPVADDTRCASCHTSPGSNSGEPMTLTPSLNRLADRAHSQGLYGTRGLVKLVQLSPQVNALLTDAQKDVLGSFACCLVPPQDLSDPMRAGQAETSEKALALMRKIRQCPDRLWPIMRQGILMRVDQITDAVSPGATTDRRADVRAKIGKLIDRVRQLGDVEFEMEKAALQKAVKNAIIRQQGDSPFKAAYFLFIPGSSRVYANYLKRLAAKPRAAAGR